MDFLKGYSIFAILFSLLLGCGSSAQHLQDGGGGADHGGGGDPDAAEFLKIGKNIATWMQIEHRFPEIDLKQVHQIILEWETSLNKHMPAKIAFTENPITDDFGTPKIAYFSANRRSVKVNRPSWRGLDLKAKTILVGTEILGLSGDIRRYDAERLGDFADEIDNPDLHAKPCKDRDLNTISKGMRCRTSKGVIFELVFRDGEHSYWKDHRTQLIWSDVIPIQQTILFWTFESEESSAYQAYRSCERNKKLKQIGQSMNGNFRLPELSEYMESQRDGFDEIASAELFYWTSTRRDPKEIHTSPFAYRFFGSKFEDGIPTAFARCILEEGKH